MKIVQETPTVLTLKRRGFMPVFVGLALFFTGVYLLSSQKDSKSLLVAITFLIFGIVSFVLLKFITVIIDKTVSTVSITEAGLFGKKTQVINFNQIKEIAIEEYVTTTHTTSTSNGSNYRSQTQVNYNLVIYLNDGKGYPISMGSPATLSVGGMLINAFGARNSIIDIGNKIASYIGVPIIDRRPPTFRETVANISTFIQNNGPQVQQNAVPPTPQPIPTPVVQPTTPTINN